MGTTNTWSVIERILRVTTTSMRGEVKLWNEEFDGKLVVGNPEAFGIAFYPLIQLYGPATRNVIRDLDALDLLVFHSG